MKMPKPFTKLFWDVPCRELHWETHKYFIMARFLNFGTMEALRWLEANHRFLDEMPDFLVSTHARKLDKKTLSFWKKYCGVEQLPWETPTYKKLRESSWVD